MKPSSFKCVQAIIACCLTVLPAALVAKVQAEQTSGSAINIGFLVPLSGAGASAGKGMVNGAQLYLDEIHHKMGGRPVELVVENDESNPATGIAKMRKLAEEEKADIVAGHYLSNIALATAPLAAKYRLPMLLSIAAADELTQTKRNPWVIRTGWCCSMSMMPFGDYTFNKLHHKRVVTVAMDYPFGWEMVGDFQKAYEAAGGKVVQKLWLPLGFTDFSSTMRGITHSADAVYLCTVGPACTIVPKQYAELGPGLPLIGAGQAFDDGLLQQIGPYMRGGISALPYSASLDTPANKRFRKAYMDKYGREPVQGDMEGYVSMMWIKQAVDALHGQVEDKEKFLAALKNVQLKESPKGPMKLDAFGNIVENIYVRKVEKVGDHYQNTVVDTFPMVSQFWKYSPEQYLSQPLSTKDYPPCKNCLTQ